MTSTAIEKPPPLKDKALRRDYTEAEIDMALTAFAICSGHRDRASALVKEQADIEIPPCTIRDWANRYHVDRYERIRAEVAPQLQRQMADTHQALAQTAAELEAEAVQRLQKRLESGEVEDRDMANIFKNAAIASGIHVEKAQLLNDRPTQIVKRDATEVLRSLQAKGVVIDVEPESEEDV